MSVGHIKLPIKPEWFALGGIKAVRDKIEDDGIVDFTFNIERRCGMQIVTFEFVFWDNAGEQQ